MQKEWIYKIGLLSVATLLALLAAECVVRIALPPPPRITVFSRYGHAPQADKIGAPKAHHVLAHSPEEGFIYIPTPTGRRLRPNARVVIENNVLGQRTIEIATNSLGYRNREIGAKSGPRLLFLGDSITFGDYLHEEETFVRLVEGLARDGGHAWETINAGVGGVSLANERAILEETGLPLEPDAVIVCYYLNDFYESPGIVLQRMPEPLAGSRLAAHLWFAVPRLLALPAGLLRPLGERPDIAAWQAEFERLIDSHPGDYGQHRQFYHQVLNAFSDWGGAWSPHSWPFVLPYLAEMHELAADRGFQFFIVAFPVLAQVNADSATDAPQQRLKAFATDRGIPFLDILPLLREANSSVPTPLFYDHCHHTPEGNRLIAQAIYRFLLLHFNNQSPMNAQAMR